MKDWEEMSRREKDVFIAEKLFKLTVIRDVWDTRSCDELTPKYDYGVANQDRSVVNSVYYYSSDIRSALLVIEEMRNRKFTIQMNNRLDKTWEVIFERENKADLMYDSSEVIYAAGDELADTICKCVYLLLA